MAAAAVVFTPPSAGAAPAAPGVVFTPPSAGGAPAIAATGLVTFTGLPTNAETITVNGRVYSFSATAPLATSEILIGANAEAMATNMTFAINSPFVGSANAVVTASVSFSGYEVRLTAKVSGTGGNALTLAKTASNTAISGATLTGGAPGSLAPPVAVFGT